VAVISALFAYKNPQTIILAEEGLDEEWQVDGLSVGMRFDEAMAKIGRSVGWH
jgi:hypothetical protein